MHLRGRVVVERVESRALRGNALRDPHVRDVPIYFPPGYDERRRFPVIFCLAGFGGSGCGMLEGTPWSPSVVDRFDALVASRRSRPAILMFPDAFTRLGGSQYMNSAATGRYEDHVAEELPALIDRRYRTIPDRAHRGVAGKSSGGYGALRLGMSRPEVFGAVACHSGDMAFEYVYLPDFPKAQRALEEHGGVAGFLRAFEKAPQKSGDLLAAMNILAMAACYSPNPHAKPLRFDLPFDPRTGEIREETWRRWLAQDPLRLVGAHAQALRSLRLLYFDCGLRDEFHLHLGARMLAARLKKMLIPHVHREFDDGHRGITYRYDVSLPLLARALSG
jgi:enterochelin esterase family protein